MSIDEKDNRHGFLFNLLSEVKGREGLDIDRLCYEIRKKIEAGDKTLGKFLELMKSFQEILPKEKQCFNVAIKALFTTSGRSRQNVLESADNQLEELKILEKGSLSALSGFRDEQLKAMESRTKEIKSEIANLREKITIFEKEEQEILLGMAARQRDLDVIENEVSKVFMDIGAEITDIRNKIVEFTDEKVSSQSITPPGAIKRHKRENEKEEVEDKCKVEETSEPQETECVRGCTMCGGQMNFYSKESIWMCYSCGHEELEKDNAGSASEFTIAKESASALETDSAMEYKSIAPSNPSPSIKRLLSRKKTCPVCRKQMNLYEDEQIWQCPFCDYQRRVV